MGIEAWLSLFFCFEDLVTGAWAKSLGCECDVSGEPISDKDRLYPCLIVLPMGFSWSFWIVQELVTQLSLKAGITRDQILVSGWPAPSLNKGVVANPYCDNLNLFGRDKAQVNALLSDLLRIFRSYGFDLHEIEWASPSAKPLGSLFCGETNSIGPRLEKTTQPPFCQQIHDVRQESFWSASRSSLGSVYA